MRRRFFVDKFDAGRAALRGDAAQHLGRVLRAEPGQLYELSDGSELWLARVEKISGGRNGAAIEFALTEKIPAHESTLRIKLLLSVVKFDRMEWCLEKSTELGVSEIVPLSAARSEKALVLAAAKRAERWRKILFASAQQSRRLRPPVLTSVEKPDYAFAEAKEKMKIIFSERTGATPLREIFRGSSVQEICLAIGPEGGWTDAEFASAAKNGFREASLGREILRTETAVIAALAVARYVLGESACQ
jgi:16S rRNA (uracil1498-N3)-methyltransferase